MNKFIRLKFYLTVLGVAFSLVTFAQPPCNLTITTAPSPATICNGESIVLTANSATATGYLWSPAGSLSSATDQVVTATPNATTTYTCNPSGCNGPDVTVVVTVHPTPTANFSHNPASPCGSVPITFTNTSTGGGNTYQWDFGDGGTSTNTNPSHTFSSATGNGTQNFTVTLIATNNWGCADTITQTITVSQIPDAALGGTGATIYNGLPYFKVCTSSSTNFLFTNISTTTATNTNYDIDWGDGSPHYITGTNWASTNHTYGVGQYTITETVT